MNAVIVFINVNKTTLVYLVALKVYIAKETLNNFIETNNLARTISLVTSLWNGESSVSAPFCGS